MEVKAQLLHLMNQYGGPVAFLLLLEEVEQVLHAVLNELPLLHSRLAKPLELLSELIEVLEKLFNRE